MRLIFFNKFDEKLKEISFIKSELLQVNINTTDLQNHERPIIAVLEVIDEIINSDELIYLKETLEDLKINFSHIFSNSREAILTGKSFKINSTLICSEENLTHKFTLKNSIREKDTLHKGTIRSGNRISSNGNLFIIGDVNPGAIVTAQENIYVWGKLLGTACAGVNGITSSCIASLYLNPLQLRISETIAIGPKEKPKENYPEIAVLEGKSIVIKPYLISY